ncbi:ceramidase [Aspergillus pseudoustus]|uniref:Ceramidase n=1 Tax=Aspergillus pseudoustus TaxID=1810923 RepID=A0ABR4JP70_9EURO
MDSSRIEPFWGPQTSYLNFCEQDYVVTRFVAEFINTLSSGVYCLFGLHGLAQLRRRNQASLSRCIPYLGLIGVGVCSGGYHMTLKYHTQMSDELSMHLLTTPLLYRILTFQTSAEYTRLVGGILGAIFTLVMVVHMVMDEFLLHAVSFGLAVLLITTRTMKTIPLQIPDSRIRAKIRGVSRFGLFCFIFGYTVWLIDTWFCPQLIEVRRFIGAPLAFFFELHGWWHVFTGIGGYVAVVIVDMITTGEVHDDPTGDMAFPLNVVSKVLDMWAGDGENGGEKQK